MTTPDPSQTPAPTPRPPTRRAVRFSVAALVALALAGGGYVAGSLATERSRELIAAPSPIPVPDGTAEPALPAGAEPATGAASSREGSASHDEHFEGGYGQRTVFRTAPGLISDPSAVPTSAHGYTLDAQSAYTAEVAARFADALDVPGEPVQADGSWLVGASDYSAPSVRLYPDGPTTVSYSNPAADPWTCAGVGQAEAEPEAAIAPAPGSGPACGQSLGDLPSDDTATAQLTELLQKVGVDTSALTFNVERYDEHSVYVTANDPTRGLDWYGTWTAAFSGAGLQYLNGSAAPVVDLGEYTLVSPTAAVARLSDPVFASFGGPRVGPATADEHTAYEVPTTPPTAPAPGTKVPWKVTTATIATWKLTTASYTGPDGAVMLLPTYDLATIDGTTWSVLAVADEHLATD